MKVIILSDGETWETFQLESDAMIAELQDVPDHADIDEIEEAIDAGRYEIDTYLWDLV
jgi:hypothetical protein